MLLGGSRGSFETSNCFCSDRQFSELCNNRTVLTQLQAGAGKERGPVSGLCSALNGAKPLPDRSLVSTVRSVQTFLIVFLMNFQISVPVEPYQITSKQVQTEGWDQFLIRLGAEWRKTLTCLEWTFVQYDWYRSLNFEELFRNDRKVLFHPYRTNSTPSSSRLRAISRRYQLERNTSCILKAFFPKTLF